MEGGGGESAGPEALEARAARCPALGHDLAPGPGAVDGHQPRGRRRLGPGLEELGHGGRGGAGAGAGGNPAVRGRPAGRTMGRGRAGRPACDRFPRRHVGMRIAAGPRRAGPARFGGPGRARDGRQGVTFPAHGNETRDGPAARPAPAVVALDGYELVALEPADAPQVLELVALRGNRYLIDLGASEHEVARLIADLSQAPWSLPLAVLHGDVCVGMATTSLANLKSLNASLLALFTDPPGSATALALYLRHVFWNFPLHRLHVQIPVSGPDPGVRGAVPVGGLRGGGAPRRPRRDRRPVLRRDGARARSGPDFESWCVANEPRLALG